MLKDSKFNASIYSTPIFCIYHDADDFHSSQENIFFLIAFKYKCAFYFDTADLPKSQT